MPQGTAQRRVFLGQFLLSLLLLAVGPFANVSAPGWLDPWIYTGYFQNFGDLVEKYGLAYYCSRLPYIFLGRALYAVFTPAVANWMLNGLLLTAVLAPLYLIIRRQYSATAAWLTVLAGAANAYLLSSIVWDYPDGPTIAYTFLGLWLLLAPPARLHAAAALLLSGACLAMAGMCNLIGGVTLVAGGVTALIWRRRGWRDSITDLLVLAAGGGACLGLWCVISHFSIHTWNILGPQWGQVRYATEHVDYLPNMWGRGSEWIRTAYRHLPPVVLIVIMGAMLLRPGLRRAPQAGLLFGAWLGLALAFGVFAWVEFAMDKILLRVFYHSVYLVIPTLLSLGTLIGTGVDFLARNGKWRGWFIGLSILALALPPLIRGFGGWPPAGETHLLLLGTATLLGTGYILLDQTRPRLLAASLLALCALCNWSVTLDDGVAKAVYRPKEAMFFPDRTQDITEGRASYQLELAADLLVLLKNGGTRGHPLYFWYDRDEPSAKLFDSLSSLYLWGYRDHTARLPGLTADELREWFPAGSRVAYLTDDPARVALRRTLLTRTGLGWREVGHWTLGRRGKRYHLTLDEITVP